MRVHTDWLLTPQRLALHVPTATGVIADVHLGYNECRRRAGEAIPLGNLAQQLTALGSAIKQQGVRRLVIAGDLFEAGFMPDVMKEFQEWLAAAGVELAAIIPGNHDRGLDDSWPLYPQGFMLERWRIVHGHEEIPAGPAVHGHVHPSVRWQGRKLPCYLVADRRLVLPAYSPDAAGVDVARDRAWHGYRCFPLHANSVADLGELGPRRPRLQRTT